SRVAGKPVTYTAAIGTIVMSEAGPRIIMQEGTYQQAQKDGGDVSVLYFDQAVVELSELTPSTDSRSRDAKELYLGELFFPTGVDDPERRDRLRVEGHQRLITPLYCFTFTVIGL